MIRLSLDQVEDLAYRALVGSNTSEQNAKVMAQAIRDGEAEGLHNVALAYLPTYCEHARVGKVDGHAEPHVRRLAPAAIGVDAGDGFCHPAFVAAEDDFRAVVSEQSVGALSITRSSSAGILGWFVERLARHGLVALAWANSSALVAPFGGNRALFGTNPIAFAAPAAGSAPVVVDMSTSATAYVNILDAARRGEPIPAHWALDASGQPTTDPDAALEGTVAPLGGHKGTGMAIMVDLLAGALTGSNFSFEASSFGDNEGGPVGVGQLFVAFSPAGFGTGDFDRRVGGLIEEMSRQEGVRAPGDRRHGARRRTDTEGVGIDEELHRKLLDYAS